MLDSILSTNAILAGFSSLMNAAVFDWVIPIFIIFVGAISIMFIKNEAWHELLAFVSTAAVVGLFVFNADYLFGKGGLVPSAASGEASSSPSPTIESPPTPTPTNTPTTPSEPVDMSIFYIIGAVILISILAIILGFIIWKIVSTSHTKVVATKQAKAQIESQFNFYREKEKSIRSDHAEIEFGDKFWDWAFNWPAIHDPTESATLNFYQKLDGMSAISSETPKNISSVDNVKYLSYPKAVIELETAWEKAKINAKRIASDKIPKEERETLKMCRTFLPVLLT